MSDASLRTLESLRRDASEAAQRRSAEVRRSLADFETDLREGMRRLSACEAARDQGRLAFAAAATVSALRLAEQRLRGLERDLSEQATRVARQRALCSEARARLAAEVKLLVEAERNRLAVGQVLDARRQVSDKRRELAEEEQRDDLLRAARGRDRPPGFG